MNATVITKTYAAPEVSVKDILRYMGCREPSPEVDSLIKKCLDIALPICRYEVCYAAFSVSIDGSAVDLGFASVESRDLVKCIGDCDSAVVFAATAGLGIDRLINKYSRTSPATALCLQAIGSERIEALCDTFCRELSLEYGRIGKLTRPRFSAGYGDLPLELQSKIFEALTPQNKIGVTLNESLIMSPSKSVTAIVGIK